MKKLLLLLSLSCAVASQANSPAEEFKVYGNQTQATEISTQDEPTLSEASSDQLLFGIFSKVKDKIKSWFSSKGKDGKAPPGPPPADVCDTVKKEFPTRNKMALANHPDKVCGGNSEFDKCVAEQSEVFKAMDNCY